MDDNYILYSNQFIYDLQAMGFTVGMLIEMSIFEIIAGEITNES
jgi:hypothetical protein